MAPRDSNSEPRNPASRLKLGCPTGLRASGFSVGRIATSLYSMAHVSPYNESGSGSHQQLSDSFGQSSSEKLVLRFDLPSAPLSISSSISFSSNESELCSKRSPERLIFPLTEDCKSLLTVPYLAFLILATLPVFCAKCSWLKLDQSANIDFALLCDATLDVDCSQ